MGLQIRLRRGGQVLAAVLSLGVVLAGCTSAAQNNTSSPGSSATASGGSTGAAVNGKITIGLVSHNIASPGIKLYRDAFVADAAKLGWTVKSVDTAGDVVAAVNQTKQWVSQGVSAIVVDTIPNNLMTEGIAAANAAKIPWFSVSSGWEKGVTNETTANEFVSGSELATALINKMGRKGNIIELTWSALPAVLARANALETEVKAQKDVKIVKKVELKVPGWAEDANKQVTNYLQTNKDVQAIWMPWDDFAPDVVRAVTQAGMADKIIIGGFDLDSSAADLLRKNGPFQMSNALNIPAFAALQVRLLKQVLAGQTVEPITYVPNCLATPQNIPKTGGREQSSFWLNCYQAPVDLEKSVG